METIPQIYLQLSNPNPAVQLEATTNFRKLLSMGACKRWHGVPRLIWPP